MRHWDQRLAELYARNAVGDSARRRIAVADRALQSTLDRAGTILGEGTLGALLLGALEQTIARHPSLRVIRAPVSVVLLSTLANRVGTIDREIEAGVDLLLVRFVELLDETTDGVLRADIEEAFSSVTFSDDGADGPSRE